MTVDVARLTAGGEWYRGETSPEVLDLGESELFRPLGGIAYALFIQALGTELLVRGALSLRLECVCSRCAGAFTTEASEPEFVTSVEISEATEFLDLTEEVREAIILALPRYPVCREACRGLCLTCGANLNERACGCRRAGKDDRWSALDALMEGVRAGEGKRTQNR